MRLDSLLEIPLFTYSRARNLSFALQFAVLNTVSGILPGGKSQLSKVDPGLLKLLDDETKKLLKDDVSNISQGYYPARVLQPESPFQHVRRVPKLLLDGAKLYLRRARGRTAEFDTQAQEMLDELPRYYRRNFHFQTNGYLSEASAEIYEHQVEMLFSGTADAMRRSLIKPLKKAFGNSDGKGLTFLEVAAGTGRMTRFVKLAFPKAKIVVTDLSEPYLKVARRRLAGFQRLDFVQAAGEKLPFQDGSFDAAYSVFLFHELPLEARKALLAESARVLKPGGFLGLVDSLQGGDFPAFDQLLRDFPANYHEPFYRNYLENPVEALVEEAGISQIEKDRALFSKLCWGKKA